MFCLCPLIVYFCPSYGVTPYCEVQRHKTGRSARLAGTVERLAGPAAELNDDPV